MKTYSVNLFDGEVGEVMKVGSLPSMQGWIYLAPWADKWSRKYTSRYAAIAAMKEEDRHGKEES